MAYGHNLLQKRYDSYKETLEDFQNRLETMNMFSKEYQKYREKCTRLANKMDEVVELAESLGSPLDLS